MWKFKITKWENKCIKVEGEKALGNDYTSCPL